MKDYTYLLKLGKNIQAIRKSLNMTQDEFSEKLNITPHFLSRVENGNSGINLDLAINICKLANCSSTTLFDEIIDSPITGQYGLLNDTDKSFIDNIIVRLLNTK